MRLLGRADLPRRQRAGLMDEADEPGIKCR